MIYRKYVSILCCDLIDVTLPGKDGDTILADNAFIVIIFGDTDDIENFAKDCVANWWPLAMFHSMSKAIFSDQILQFRRALCLNACTPSKRPLKWLSQILRYQIPFRPFEANISLLIQTVASVVTFNNIYNIELFRPQLLKT